ncbi:hypothetical protein BKP45_21285 [Anaerobacillus alkalidiazotrophicus]|uniref:DUF4190 domain-containing protein n=1 Tax=Anaerobacillus alkalidiazotrophicus TaxID=472963 RepID=A0A1S2LW51_9BACI|nr:hypothetical protein BKP45_21285 [Anaerobacillus alkalidiazotrophicus]
MLIRILLNFFVKGGRKSVVEKLKTNSKAVVSLTLGILSILIPAMGMLLGIIGIIFSKIAKEEIENTNEAGSGLATSGMVCSIVGAVIQLFLVLVGILSFHSI